MATLQRAAGQGQRQCSREVRGGAGGDGAGLGPASVGNSTRGDGEPAGHSPLHRLSSLGTAAASEPSMSSPSVFPVAGSYHIRKRSKAFSMGKEDLL